MKRVISVLLVVITVFSLFTVCASAASTAGFDILSSQKYAKTYTVATSGKTIPYTSKSLSTRGTTTYGKSNSSYIDNAADELYILDAGYTNGVGWLYVSYPTSNGRVKAYIPMSAVTKNNGNQKKYTSSGKFYCSVREGWSNNSSYYVAKNDTVYLIAEGNSKYQVLYNISNGCYRLAWCNKADFQKYCGKVSAPATQSTSSYVDVTAYFANKKITIKSVENNKYLMVNTNASTMPVLCYKAKPTSSDVFTVSSLTSDGWVGLKSTNGLYLTAQKGVSGAPVQATAKKLQSWECFRIYMKGNNFYIKAQANNKWLSARVDTKNYPLCAVANSASTWERFSISYGIGDTYISAAELISTARANNLTAKSNAYKALLSINTKYANKLTAEERKGTAVFMFEGVGSNNDPSKRLNAMCVVVKNGDIVYLNRNSSTIPDYPFNPSRNEGDDMPTTKSGIYSFKTVNHRGEYAALNVKNAKVVRFSSKKSFYNSTSYGINVHRRSTDNIAGKYDNWVNSAGCLIIGKSGKGTSSEYAAFIKAVGIVGKNAAATAKYSSSVTGKIIIDRTYAASYLSGVGYSNDAIAKLG